MIRHATQDDYPTFLRLWLAFLEDQRGQGDEVLPTPKTVSFYTLLFAAYTTGARKGVVLLDDDVAVVMVGEGLAEPAFDTAHDPKAHGWGLYVAPGHREKGISRGLYEVLKKDLREMGFRTITTSILMGNQMGYASLVSEGYQLVHISGVKHLVEEE